MSDLYGRPFPDADERISDLAGALLEGARPAVDGQVVAIAGT